MSNLLLSDERKMAYVRQLKVKRGQGGKGVALGTMIAMGPNDVIVNHFFN